MDAAPLTLSPSSASDFKSCPQLFKFRAVDRLPEPVSVPAARGTVVHAVLERLLCEPPQRRHRGRAEDLLEEVWQEALAEPDALPEGWSEGDELGSLAEARRLLDNYFRLEDPATVDPRRLEWWVSYELADLELRGIIDRVEVRDDGSWVLTDYKTGRVPPETRELRAFFGLRFYALVCWRAFGVMPGEIRLVYLSEPSVLRLNPHERMLAAFERQIVALGDAVRRALRTGDWRPRPSPLCLSCAFHGCCPAWAPATAGRSD